MTARIQWIDVLKGIAIIFVVLGHCNPGHQLYTYLYSFHLFLFIFVSGYLFDRTRYSGYGTFVKRKAKTLLLPYAIFYAIIFGYYTINPLHTIPYSLFRYNLGNTAYIVAEIQAFLWAGNAFYIINNAVVLWFLPCLFLTENIFYGIHTITGQMPRRIVAMLIVVAALAYFEYVILRQIRFPWSLDVALTCVLFFSIGNLIKPLVPAQVFSRSNLVLTAMVIAFIVNIAASRINGMTDLATVQYKNYFLYLTSAAGGVAFWVFCVRRFTFPVFLTYLGRNSLIVYGLHLIFKEWALLAFSAATSILLNDATSIDLNIKAGIISGMIILFCIPFIELTNRVLLPIFNREKHAAAES